MDVKRSLYIQTRLICDFTQGLLLKHRVLSPFFVLIFVRSTRWIRILKIKRKNAPFEQRFLFSTLNHYENGKHAGGIPYCQWEMCLRSGNNTVCSCYLMGTPAPLYGIVDTQRIRGDICCSLACVCGQWLYTTCKLLGEYGFVLMQIGEFVHCLSLEIDSNHGIVYRNVITRDHL